LILFLILDGGVRLTDQLVAIGLFSTELHNSISRPMRWAR
jgi:hypothetical protein